MYTAQAYGGFYYFTYCQAFYIRYNGFMSPAKRLLKILKEKKLTLSIAESCSGGLLSNLITDIPGSSRAFLLGIISYSNSSKCKILKIPQRIIKDSGAVSKSAAGRMSENVRKLGNSSLGIGITGIAGPGGGSKKKPVGTVFIAICSIRKTITRKFLFRGTRLKIKGRAVREALKMLLEFIR